MTEILTLLKSPLYLIFIGYLLLFVVLYVGLWAAAKFLKMKKKPEWMKLLTHNWFFVFIAFAFLAMITLQAYDMFKDKLPSKTTGGKDVVFVIGDQKVTTDTFYDELYTYYGDYSVFTNLKRTIIDTSIESTTEIKATVKTQMADLIKQWEDMATYYASYGYTYETIALYYLQDAGYSSVNDIDEYVTQQVKEKLLQKEYLNTHMDELYPTFATAKKPRVVSHILIAMDDPAKPTADEAARLQAVKDAIAGGMSFEDAVLKYSEDTTNNKLKGLLGYMDSDTSFQTNFRTAALALNAGETSAWVTTTYGYHLIRVDSTSLEDLKTYDGFYDALIAKDATLANKILWEKALELNVNFNGNTELEASIKKLFGITE